MATKLAHDGPQVGLHPGYAQGQGWAQRSRDTGTFVISRKLLLAGKWLDRDKTHSFATNLPFPFSVPFSSAPQSPKSKWLWVCTVSSAIAHIMKQFVKLSVIGLQYGLTFCLYVRTLYEAPLHSLSRLSIRQLNLMSKCWNELLHHWRSSCLSHCYSIAWDRL